MNNETELLKPIELGQNPSRKRAEVWIDFDGPVGIVRQRIARVRRSELDKLTKRDAGIGDKW